MPNSTNITHLPPKPPSPATVDDLIAQRITLATRTLNQDIEQIHLMLWGENQEYRAYLEEIWASEAIEGSLIADDYSAAEIIRKFAQSEQQGDLFPLAKRAKKHSIMLSMHVVLKRYNQTRKQRRDMALNPSTNNGTVNEAEAAE
jgi:hypothetical protein